MATPSTSTRDQMVSIVDDIELVSRDLLEALTTTQNSTQRSGRIEKALEALIQSENKLKAAGVIAQKQGECQVRIDALNTELDRKKQEIFTLQKNLKDCETQLASAVWEAKRKLDSIRKAEEKAVTVDELIRFAHRISASNSVVAPPNWMPGDQSRRPYPTDVEIRQGLLAKNFEALRDAYHSRITEQKAMNISADNGSGSGNILSGYSWQPPGTGATGATDTSNPLITPQIGLGAPVMEDSNVGIMSGSDTSSSSSSDEQ